MLGPSSEPAPMEAPIPMRASLRLLPVAALLATMLVVAGCNLLGGGGSLTGKAWQWSASTTTAPASQSVVPDPSSYTIEFKGDGTFEAKADCNQVSGNYTTSGSSLTIVPGPSTLVACADDSLADLYLAGLAATQSYAIVSDQLVLTTSDGTMTFD
jgi:heat shock protein HslJ